MLFWLLISPYASHTNHVTMVSAIDTTLAIEDILTKTTFVTSANHACRTPLVILAIHIHIHDTFSTFYTFYIFNTFYTFYFKAGPLMPELLGHL